MLEFNKKGFSLIEVMLLMVVFSVILAASTTVISRKSKNPPINATHGVYRCIANNNGTFTQDVYNSYRLISSDIVERCQFAPPKYVSQFQVDYYTAGAGGINYAEYMPEENEQAEIITYEDMFNYSQNPNNPNGQFLQKMNRIPMNLTEDNFRTLLNGFPARIWNVVTNAGDGGDVTVKNVKPTNQATCLFNGTPLGFPTGSQTFLKLDDHYEDTRSGSQRSTSSVLLTYACIQKNIDRYKNSTIYFKNRPLSAIDVNFIFNNNNPKFHFIPSVELTAHGQRGGRGSLAFFEANYNLNDVDAFFRSRNINPDFRMIFYYGNLLSWDMFDEDHWDNNNFRDMLVPLVITEHANNNRTFRPGYANMPKLQGEGVARDMSSNPLSSQERANQFINIFAQSGQGSQNKHPNGADYNSPGIWYTNGRGLGAGSQINLVFSEPLNGMEGRLTISRANDITQETMTSIMNRIKNAIKDGSSMLDYPGNFPGDHYMPIDWADDRFAATVNTSNNASRRYGRWNLGEPLKVVPQIRMDFNIFTKQYRVGQSGRPGKHKVDQPKTLGTACTFVVPRGGAVVNYRDNLADDADFRRNERALGVVTMTCTDKEGNQVYRGGFQNRGYDTNRLNSDGGIYNVALPEWGDRYEWNPAQGDNFEWVVSAPEAETAPSALAQRDTVWTKIFNFMINHGRALRNFRVGFGGQGTVLTDSCTARRGAFDIRTQRHISTIRNQNLLDAVLAGNNQALQPYDFIEDQDWNDAHRIRVNPEDENSPMNGMHPQFRGFDCYATDNNSNTHVIGTGGRARENDVYRREVQAGGPGAIVITW